MQQAEEAARHKVTKERPDVVIPPVTITPNTYNIPLSLRLGLVYFVLVITYAFVLLLG